MRSLIITALVTTILTLTGCGSHEEPPAPPVTDAQLASLRATYRQDPVARVGVVTAVLDSANLASVGKVPVKDFATGDIITFMDSNGKILTMGKVEAISHDTLTVRYDFPQKDGRVPAPGDVAARFIR